MSRLRIGHGPDDWKPEDPATARIHSKAFSVQAENVGSMRPILTPGGNFREARTETDGWRKESKR